MRDDNIDGGPAFPTDSESQIGNALWHHSGMPLRDYFAAKALNGLCATRPSIPAIYVAEAAYEMADAMLKARSA